MTKPRILFLCTGNSCRSQMAEGWLRHLHGDRFESLSAGIDPHGLNPLAVRAMAEAGLDISTQKSESIDRYLDGSLDTVFTVCDKAHDSCPWFPGEAKVLHVGFDDPPRLAKDAKSDEEAMTHYRRVRDEIRDFVQDIDSYLSGGVDGPV